MKKPEGAPTQSELRALIKSIGKESEREALSALCAAAKKQAARLYIAQDMDWDGLLHALVYGEPKARKNAARLMGAIGEQAHAPALIDALAHEGARFVRPSILLALGAIGGEEAARALNAYTLLPAAEKSEDKHVREESEALRRARAAVSQTDMPVFSGFSAPQVAFLTVPMGMGAMLEQELAKLHIPCRAAGKRAVSIQLFDVNALFQARCFHEILFPLADNLPPEPKKLAQAIRAPFTRLLRACHSYEGAFPYRVEYRADGDRAAFIQSLCAALDSPELINKPSGYGAELRILPHREGNLRVFVRLYTIKDTRFDYRMRTLPASMHPATAACIARYAQGFAPDALRVLDPCAGSGTLLIEWGKLVSDASLTAMDISKDALSAARENFRAAGLNAGLVHHDLTDFAAREPYDLVLANLPFGNRVSNHKTNERLYAALVQNLKRWLRPNGVAILYTMEFTLLKRLIDATPGMERISMARTEAGGLTPHIFAVRMAGIKRFD